MQLNEIKSKELMFSERLMEKFPKILKIPLDPSQEGFRHSTTHIVIVLESFAKNTLHDRHLFHSWRFYRRGLSTHLVGLVPYDRYLWLLFETSEKQPLDVEVDKLEEVLTKVSPNKEAQGTDPEKTFVPPVPEPSSRAL